MSVNEKRSWDTPNIEEDQAALCIHSTRRIAAPASLVFRTLRNTETWKDWNRFVPRVNITYQPPDEDLATSAEIEELVKNTSLAGSYDSDLTDGMSGSGPFKQKLSENGERPSTPPLKLASRRGSQISASDLRRASQVSSSDHSSAASMNGQSRLPVPYEADEAPKMSAAQKFAAAQEERKTSVAAGSSLPVFKNTLQDASTISPIRLAQTPPRVISPRGSIARQPEIDPTGRRKSKTPSLQKAMRARQASLNLLYGEPSIRLQLHTRMTFFSRMSASRTQALRETHFVVTEVSRPDDPVTDGANLTQLTRSKTHTLNRMEVYRIVWVLDNTMASVTNVKNGSAFPKSLLVTERVHEIRPITLGDGSEECEVTTWELQKGPIAKVVKKRFGEYLQAQFELWTKGLGEFCEGMTGKVDRRDFSIVVDEDLNAVGVITF